MTNETRDNTIPDEIVRMLGRVIRRARLLTVLRGSLATLAVAVGCVLAIMAIDYWVVIFSEAVRWAMSFAAGVATVLCGLWFIARPLARGRSLAGSAMAIERHHPQLQERLSSTIELLTSTDAPALRGSDELIAALARQAVTDAGALSPAGEISFRGAIRPLVVAVVVLGVLVGLLAVWPDQAGRLLRRAMLANVSRVSDTSLKVTRVDGENLRAWGRDGIDYVLLTGGRLQVELTVADPAVSDAQLRKTAMAGGPENVLAMTRLPDAANGSRRFAMTCPPAAGSFRFRLGAGDALTRYFGVRVVDQPEVSGIDVRLEYPAYTSRESETAVDVAGDIAAVAGATATITIRAAAPPTSVDMLVGGGCHSLNPVGAAGAYVHRIDLVKGLKTKWSVRLIDEYGFTNTPAEHAIEALLDKPPRVVLSVPAGGRLRLRPTDKLPAEYRVWDDFGVSALALQAEVDGRKLPATALSIGPTTMPTSAPADKQMMSVSGMAVLDLGAMDLQGARQVVFRVVVEDWLAARLGGPGRGVSEPLVIDIDAGAPTFADQVVQAAAKRLGEMLQAALKDLGKSRQDSVQLRRLLPKTKVLSGNIVTRIDRLRGHLASAEGSLRDAIDANAAGAFEGFNARLAAIADEHVTKARGLAGQIKILDAPKARAGAADEADFQVDRSIKLIKAMLKDLIPAADRAKRQLGPGGVARVVREAQSGAGPMMTDLSAAQLAKLGVSSSDWARLPGKLRDQILQAARTDGPAEYRELIRRYFRELARRGAGGASSEKKP